MTFVAYLGILSTQQREEKALKPSRFTNGSARRVAKLIMDFSEDRVKEILSGIEEPEFRKEILKNIVQNRIERGRK